MCGFLGAFLGMVIWLVLYLSVLFGLLKASARSHGADRGDLLDYLPPFWWGGLLAAAFALFGTCIGPERMMDAFETIMRNLSKAASRGSHD